MLSYLKLILIFTTLLFLIIVPTHRFNFDDFEILIKGMQGSGKVLIFGNSVVKHTSKCDTDHRSIAQILTDDENMQVIDMSRGGMPIGRMLDIIEVLDFIGIKPKQVILQFPLEGNTSTVEIEPTSLKTYLLANFEYLGNQITRTSFTKAPDNTSGQYRVKSYGDYSTFSRINFPVEKAHMQCPESLGHDINFIRFMYWRNFINNRTPLEKLDVVKMRVTALNAKGISMLLWISPANYTDLSSLLGDEAFKNFADYRKLIINSFNGYKLLDSSNVLEGNDFVDRWCACGHMGELGRKKVAHLLSQKQSLNQ